MAAGVGHSQQLATLSVTVVDPSGKLIAGAGVSLSDANTGLTRNAQTNRAGLAVLTAVAAGDYQLTVKANGFSLWEHPLTLTVGQTALIPVQMRVAAVKESVTVSSTGVQGIDTEKTEASDVIQPSQIDNLPISDRDFIDFVLLTPNANVGRSTATASQSAFQEIGTGTKLRWIARNPVHGIPARWHRLHGDHLRGTTREPISRLGTGIPSHRWTIHCRLWPQSWIRGRDDYEIRHERRAWIGI